LGARNVKGMIEGQPELFDGLKDIERFFHGILVHDFHLSVGYSFTD
jgi:hypothetical protein